MCVIYIFCKSCKPVSRKMYIYPQKKKYSLVIFLRLEFYKALLSSARPAIFFSLVIIIRQLNRQNDFYIFNWYIFTLFYLLITLYRLFKDCPILSKQKCSADHPPLTYAGSFFLRVCRGITTSRWQVHVRCFSQLISKLLIGRPQAIA